MRIALYFTKSKGFWIEFKYEFRITSDFKVFCTFVGVRHVSPGISNQWTTSYKIPLVRVRVRVGLGVRVRVRVE